MINPTWVKRFNQPPTRTASSRIIQSWDPGGDNHWSVCVTLLLQDHKHYLLHVLRDRMCYSMLVARAIAHAQTYRATRILVEHALIGPDIMMTPKPSEIEVSADLCHIACGGSHMATNLAIDPELIEQALKVSGERTKKAAVTKALQEFIAQRRQKRLLDLMGKLEWDSSYHYKKGRARD